MTHLKVLVPQDGSAFARAILPTLEQVLRPDLHHLTLFRVADLPEANPVVAASPLRVSWSYALREAGRTNPHLPFLDEVAKPLKTQLAGSFNQVKHELEAVGFEVSVVVRFGDPAEEIAAYAREEHVDLIALATHGRSGLNRLVMGSVAERVLRSVSLTVLMLRPTQEVADEDVPLGTLVTALPGA